MRLCYSLIMLMALLMLGSALSLLSGCGKKGALYHPPDPEAIARAKLQKEIMELERETEYCEPFIIDVRPEPQQDADQPQQP